MHGRLAESKKAFLAAPKAEREAGNGKGAGRGQANGKDKHTKPMMHDDENTESEISTTVIGTVGSQRSQTHAGRPQMRSLTQLQHGKTSLHRVQPALAMIVISMTIVSSS